MIYFLFHEGLSTTALAPAAAWYLVFIVLGLTQLSHSSSQRSVFACGSMVFFDHMFVVFVLYERKNDKRRKRKYHSAAGSERQLRKSYVYRFCPHQRKKRYTRD